MTGGERFGDSELLGAGVEPFVEVVERRDLPEQRGGGDSQQRRLAVDAAVVGRRFVGGRDLHRSSLFGGFSEGNSVSYRLFYGRITPPSGSGSLVSEQPPEADNRIAAVRSRSRESDFFILNIE